MLTRAVTDFLQWRGGELAAQSEFKTGPHGVGALLVERRRRVKAG